MPVILDNGSEAIRTWLDPERTEWSKDLQSLLKPYEGELECYQVSKDVGKVGNNSPSFVVPIDSAANKNNIANFFGNQQKAAKPVKQEAILGKVEQVSTKEIKVEHEEGDIRGTTDQVEGTEDNAPFPIPARLPSPTGEEKKGVKRERSEEDDGDTADGVPQQKRRISDIPGQPPSQSPKKSPTKSPMKKAQGKTRSAVSNGSAARASPAKGDGSMKITSFFGK